MFGNYPGIAVLQGGEDVKDTTTASNAFTATAFVTPASSAIFVTISALVII